MPRILRTGLLPLLAILVASAGCDRSGAIVIVPEFDLTYSFESGLGDWYANGIDLIDPPDTWSVATSSDEASVGGSSVALTLENANSRGKIWIERVFEVQPERAYDIEISFDLGSADANATSWRIIAGAHTTPPDDPAHLVIQGTTAQQVIGPNVEFSERRYTVRATADEEGQLYVVLGVWGTSPAFRTYYIDNVRLLFTRVSVGG